MRIKLNKHGLFDERWAWTGTELRKVLKLLSTCEIPVLHVCSGCSLVGDVRLDRVIVGTNAAIKTAMPEYRGKANCLGSMLDLPFKDSSFNTVICDPPYDYKWFENGIYQQMVDEITRVTKVSGKIIWYSPVVFMHPTTQLINAEYSRMGKRCYYKILSTNIKKNGQIGDYV